MRSRLGNDTVELQLSKLRLSESFSGKKIRKKCTVICEIMIIKMFHVFAMAYPTTVPLFSMTRVCTDMMCDVSVYRYNVLSQCNIITAHAW